MKRLSSEFPRDCLDQFIQKWWSFRERSGQRYALKTSALWVRTIRPGCDAFPASGGVSHEVGLRAKMLLSLCATLIAVPAMSEEARLSGHPMCGLSIICGRRRRTVIADGEGRL